MQIETKRFVIRDFVSSDAPAFLAYHADLRAAEFYGPDEAAPEHAQKLLATFHEWASATPRQNYQFAVVLRKAPQTLVGSVGLRCADQPAGQAEFGIELAPDYWGAYAYAVEIGRALLEFGFDTLGLHSIVGSTVSGNSAITRLAEWSRAEIVATHPAPEWAVRRGWRRLDWRLTRQQWQQSRG